MKKETKKSSERILRKGKGKREEEAILEAKRLSLMSLGNAKKAVPQRRLSEAVQGKTEKQKKLDCFHEPKQTLCREAWHAIEHAKFCGHHSDR